MQLHSYRHIFVRIKIETIYLLILYIAMKNENPALEKYAELMIEKMKEVHSSNWTKPWFTSRFKGFPQNLTGRSYNNQNKVVLYFICDKYKYKTPIFVTFNQARNEKVQVLKGAKAFPISYYDLIIKDKITGKRVTREFYKNLSPAEQEKYKVIPFLKYYNVFNLDQTNYSEVYPEKWNALVKEFGLNINSGNNFRNALLDSVIEKQTWLCPITLKEQDGAFYSPYKDSITLPERYQFIDDKEFYYTALHEMAHSTGHPERLARKFGSFGSTEYAREELIAELSAAVTGRDLGMAVTPRKENAQYLDGWCSIISSDPKFIMTILSDVNKAVTSLEEGIGLNQEHEDSTEKQNQIPVMTEDEYLASRGYENPFYSVPTTHKGNLRPQHQQNLLSSISITRSNKYEAERNVLKEEYRAMLSRGEIRQPTKTERIIKAANGHPDLESTQAARRMAMAMGINWKSEKNGLPVIHHYYCDQHGQLHARFYCKDEMQDRMVWKSGNDYILCTGSRSGGDYTEHILPTKEILRIKELNTVELQSSGCRSLLNDSSGEFYIEDKSTGKIEALTASNIDLGKQPPEAIKKLLSGQQTEMSTQSGATQIMRLSKSPIGWTLKTEKQSFNTIDNAIEI